MKMTVKIEREDAEKLMGEFVLKQYFAERKDMRVENVSWDSYRTQVEIKLTDDPKPVKAVTPAPEAEAA